MLWWGAFSVRHEYYYFRQTCLWIPWSTPTMSGMTVCVFACVRRKFEFLAWMYAKRRINRSKTSLRLIRYSLFGRHVWSRLDYGPIWIIEPSSQADVLVQSSVFAYFYIYSLGCLHLKPFIHIDWLQYKYEMLPAEHLAILSFQMVWGLLNIFTRWLME